VIPVQGLRRVCVVVRDLKASARAHALVYGIERWRVSDLNADRLSGTSAFGFGTPFTYATATGSKGTGVTFELVQPTGGMSTFAEFLVTRGEGVHSIGVADVPAADPDAYGVPVAQTATVDGRATHYHLDTRRALGGFYVEVVAGEHGPAPADREWVFPGDGLPGDVTRVWHLGIAVRDLMGRLPAYGALLGAVRWDLVHLRPEWATLDGEPVEHAFLVARGELAGFELEVIQPTAEPTHYRRHLLDPVGEGIHHVLALPDLDEAGWLVARGWMESRGAPVAMSGRVGGGAAEFFYLDTRRMLGGYLLEAIVRRPDAPPRGEPDFRLDLSARASAQEG
jgi:Glyoxalase/Bleomycin resistance protein/Dioxygenase superfamily